MIKKKSLDEMN
ncbi:hypothetical protein RDI58_009503 [Solanum bulbocastanum]|uniref:Uncharacterized protein n=1 Tax=Solanum bulbocastanum TaxID=147425 RepID=A0AAN8YP92_SOLBU